MLLGDVALDLFPIHAEGRVGEHVVELLAVELIGGEGVAEFDVRDVLALNQHVGLADGVALRVQLLTEGAHDSAGVELVHVFHARGEEAAGAGGGIVDGADDAGLGEGVVVLHEDERGGETHNVARGEVLAGGLVGTLGEAPDEFFEDEAHLVIGNGGGAEVGLADALDDLVEQVGVVELADEIGEVEILKNLAGVLGEGGDVGVEVGFDAGLAEGAEIHTRGVEEGEAAGGAEEKFFAGLLGEVLFGEFVHFGEDGGLGRGEHAFETAEQRERENDAAVLALLEVAAEKIGDGPGVGGEVVGGLGHAAAGKREGGRTFG